jgi:hypothetical protein
MNERQMQYRERTWAPAWVWVLIWGASLLGAGTVAHGAYQHAVTGVPFGDSPMSTLGLSLLAGGVMLFPILMTATFMRLDVEVRADHLFVSFGPVHLVRKRIPYAEMQLVRGVTYSPIRDFGGWGVRWRGRKTAWTIRGNEAVKVVLRSGKRIYVGSRFSRRLAGRIEVAMRG